MGALSVAAVEPPLTVWRVLLDWRIDPVIFGLVVGSLWFYLAGVRRLARRGRRWAVARTAAFVSGLAVLTFATMSGLARYDAVLFSAHVVQHLLLGMVAPVLLALGAPITLAIQASHRHAQVGIVHLLHTPVVRVLTHPLFAFALFSGTLAVLYFTSLYELSLRNEVVHAWVHLHFLVSGMLFFWVIVGLDPSGWRLPYGARLLLVLLAVPFHAFVGVALLTSGQVVASDWYVGLGRTWGASPLADQRTGAGLLWGMGDLLAFVVAMIVVAQWVRHEDRDSRRLDRRSDAGSPGSVRG